MAAGANFCHWNDDRLIYIFKKALKVKIFLLIKQNQTPSLPGQRPPCRLPSPRLERWQISRSHHGQPPAEQGVPN